MPEEFITLKEVLYFIDTGKKFDFRAITCDIAKDTGGEILEGLQVHKHNWIPTDQFKKLSREQKEIKKPAKNPRHYENSTRNIVFAGGEIRKIHIRLIRKFNGKTVL